MNQVLDGLKKSAISQLYEVPLCMAEFMFPREFHRHVSFVSLFVILFTTALNPVFAKKRCDFPAIFNLGASNSDTGGLAAAFLPPKSPYGDTYFHRPAGRYSDGRIILDFIGNILFC